MNSFERLMLKWATEGEGEDEVRTMLNCYLEDDGLEIEDLAPDLIGWNVLDIFTSHHNYAGGLYPFISEITEQIDDYDLGKAVIRYYEEHM